jgi:hypothetical protein
MGFNSAFKGLINDTYRLINSSLDPNPVILKMEAVVPQKTGNPNTNFIFISLFRKMCRL